MRKSLRSVALLGAALGMALAVVPAAHAEVHPSHATANAPISKLARLTPHHRTAAFQSTNWSGYAVTGTFTTAVGHWTVPNVTASADGGDRFSSQWVGIDGFNNQNLIQTGTEADFVNGRASYIAWWEILPAAETPIGLAVRPGDSITASVTKVSGTTWRIRIANTSTGQSFTTNRTYRGAGASAEWIEEATQVNGVVGPPAKFSSFSFTNLTANGASPNLNTSEEILLVQNGITYSTPSAPSGGNAFSVRYTGGD
jgi:hypothetical protein